VTATTASTENPHAGQGSVLLDIGGDVGALVVIMPPAMEGVEVEINRIDVDLRDHGDHHEHDHDGPHEHEHDDGGRHVHHEPHRPHVAVVARPVEAGVIHSLVFPELAEGRYELYRRPAEPVELTVSVRGGEVTEATWPGA
jgi:hypothetical protein